MKTRSYFEAGREELLDRVKTVYAELARRPIDRNCQAISRCCRFQLTGEIPNATLGEAHLALQGWKSSGRKLVALDCDVTLVCPFLDDRTGRCRIYESRPFACRTHFCRPAGGPYPRRQVVDLIGVLEQIDQHLGGNGAGASLPVAIRRALAHFE